MGYRWIAFVTVTLVVAATAPAPAIAGAPTEHLRPSIDQVLRILEDPALKGPAHTADRRTALRGVIENVIDFPDAARRALGPHWQGRTDAEREEFVRLFKDLVTYSYVIQLDAYAGEKIVFVGESEDEDVATVMTKVQSRQGSIVAVDYRMHQRGPRWLVYDVSVEGVSLVANYRAQFNTIVRTASYAELVRRVRVRVAELAGPNVHASSGKGVMFLSLMRCFAERCGAATGRPS